MTLTIKETEKAIKCIKDTFEKTLAAKLNLIRVSAPLFVLANQGINDGLNGFEQPITFDAKNFAAPIQIVHSLAKWKRIALKKYHFDLNEGLYTDMNAIRKDEVVDATHSLYVDQWDWETIINHDQRNINVLKNYVRKIVHSIHSTSLKLHKLFPLDTIVTDKQVSFITSEELLRIYPNCTSKERERLYSKEKGIVFIIGIGKKLSNGQSHENRAPDYDDWDLNGDLLYYFEPLDVALEISSMGIRVSADSLQRQMKLANKLEDLSLPYHRAILSNELPYTIGGGIGQSRLCQLLLLKRHIGEVQASVWPDDEILKNIEKGVHFL